MYGYSHRAKTGANEKIKINVKMSIEGNIHPNNGRSFTCSTNVISIVSIFIQLISWVNNNIL